jgi:6-phosphofructokinase
MASATIEARNNGLRVLGIHEGYRHLVNGDTSHVKELESTASSQCDFENERSIDTRDLDGADVLRV